MFEIFTNGYTALYFILAVVCEYLTRYGIYQIETNGRSTFLTLAKTLSYLLLSFVVYYSYVGHWYIFPLLLLSQSIIFIVINAAIKLIIKVTLKPNTRVKESRYYTILYN